MRMTTTKTKAKQIAKEVLLRERKLKAAHDNGWDHGFIYALAQVNRIRGDSRLVAELMRESGISIERFSKVEPYDLKEVKRALRKEK